MLDCSLNPFAAFRQLITGLTGLATGTTLRQPIPGPSRLATSTEAARNPMSGKAVRVLHLASLTSQVLRVALMLRFNDLTTLVVMLMNVEMPCPATTTVAGV
jgi:hypothetical protein